MLKTSALFLLINSPVPGLLAASNVSFTNHNPVLPTPAELEYINILPLTYAGVEGLNGDPRGGVSPDVPILSSCKA
jgi:hypothetical protein